MVRQMENYQSSLDAAFHALADPTRRAVLSRLTQGPASVKELAEPFDMGLPSFMKHLHVLESDGLIRSEKVGRVRTCRINAERLAAAEAWLAAFGHKGLRDFRYDVILVVPGRMPRHIPGALGM